jgi:glycosyltransferase involved in cell wall biosynthesis
VRKQNHDGGIQIVLWDDGSRDPRCAKAYAGMGASDDDAAEQPGSRTVAVYRTEQQRGIARARNEGARRAGAEWLVWLDGDDELPPDAISGLLASVRRTGNPFAIGQCRVVYPGGATQVHRNVGYLAAWRRHQGSAHDPLANVVFNTHGGIVRRDLFERTGGFDPHFSHAELVDWFRRLFRALPSAEAFDVLDDVTYVYRKRGGSHSSDRARVELQRLAALQRYASSAGVPPAELDAPMVNAETGCPEYKRVERDCGSAGGELVDGVPARP